MLVDPQDIKAAIAAIEVYFVHAKAGRMPERFLEVGKNFITRVQPTGMEYNLTVTMEARALKDDEPCG